MKLPKFSMTVADQNKNRLKLAKVNRNFPTAKFCALKCRLKMAVIYSPGLKNNKSLRRWCSLVGSAIA